MPPKRTTKKAEPKINVENDSESELELSEEVQKSPVVYISNSKSASDSDRVQLAHAMNNFTIKTDQLLSQMKEFDTFKEKLFKLDILIESKKQEYDQMNKKLELDYENKRKGLEGHHTELTKKLGSDHSDKIKKSEMEFADKKKFLTNAHEDETIQMKRKIDADKSKACVDYAKEANMKFIKDDDHKSLLENVQKAQHDYNELKKTFDKQCASIRDEEKAKYTALLKSETVTMDLTHKANNAQLCAQTDQQKKEIIVLNNTIENLKGEVREGRELVKNVAASCAKSSITQTIGGKNQ
jgi:hypothetical protein